MPTPCPACRRRPGQPDSRAHAPLYDGSIEEAAIRFAHGDDAGAEAILLQTLAPDSPSADHDDTWLALLDLYRAVGDAEKFAAACVRYAEQTKRAAPEWISLRALARDAQATAAATANRRRGRHRSAAPTGRSPSKLTREGLLGLTRALAAAGPSWKLDWNALDAIEADAAGPLRALFNHWADSAVQLRFAGSDRLLIVLTEATPVNDRRVDAVWWQLHMAALRVMHRADEFELLALNYCITYEVSPPPWEDPKGDFGELEAEPQGPAPEPGSGFAISAIDDEPGDDLAPAGRVGHAALAGELVGESLSTWERLDAELAGAPNMSVSCASLVRVDFVAAGTLLNWVTARDAREQRVAFVDAHRLIAAFFGVIGIADHAEVAVRPN